MNIGRVYPKRVGPTLLTTSAALQFVADKRYGIERWTFTNYSINDLVNVTLYIVPLGASVADGYKIIGELIVAPNDVTTVLIPIVLDIGDKVYALASSLDSINFTFNVNDVEMEIQ